MNLLTECTFKASYFYLFKTSGALLVEHANWSEASEQDVLTANRWVNITLRSLHYIVSFIIYSVKRTPQGKLYLRNPIFALSSS